MSARVTEAQLRAKVDGLNARLGFDPAAVRWDTVGALRLDGAYGGTAVVQIANSGGGVHMLSGYLTKRELSLYLSGMLAVQRVAEEVTA